MDTYFCFSDECGDYKQNMSARQIRKHPFYVRSTLIINSNEWKQLNNDFRDLKGNNGLPLQYELKWSDLWSLRHYQNNEKEITEDNRLYPFREHDYHDLIDFVEETLMLIAGLEEKKIIISYSRNSDVPAINEKGFLAMHIQEHMQRIEMELQVDNDDLGVLFIDPVSNEKDKHYREIYYDLFENGDFIENYMHIKDSLNIEYSHHSVGIQLTDYISGAFSSVLKSDEHNRYSRGVGMFFTSVCPNLRRGRHGQVQGYGIREVPRNNEVRRWLVDQLQRIEAMQNDD